MSVCNDQEWCSEGLTGPGLTTCIQSQNKDSKVTTVRKRSYLSLLLAFAGFAALLILSAKTWTEAIISQLSKSDGRPSPVGKGACSPLPGDKGPSASLTRLQETLILQFRFIPVALSVALSDVYFMQPFMWCIASGHAFFPSKFILALVSPLRFSYFSQLKMPFSLTLSLWMFVTVPSDKMKYVSRVSQPFSFF